MNGPTVKCTVNHNKPGAKKRGGGSAVGYKEVINFKNACIYCFSYTLWPGNDFFFLQPVTKKPKKPKKKKKKWVSSLPVY